MSRIATIDPRNANGKTAELFDVVQQKMGKVPNVLRVLGNSPAALQAYLALSDALSGSRFNAREKEAIALTVAGANDCDYCASAHGFISRSLKVSDADIQGHLQAESSDPRLNAVLQFARAVVDRKGWAGEQDLDAARQAGLSDQETVEIIALTVANLLTNYINHVAGTEIDFPALQR